MIQKVKTTVRWTDKDGNALGAFCEMDIDLPKWGKRQFLRQEIHDFVIFLDASAKDSKKRTISTFRDYAFDAFDILRITKIISKTDGSYLSLKDDQLSKFINDNFKQ